MKIAIVYHQVKEGVDCPDGVAAAWVVYRYFESMGFTPDVFGCTYQSEPPKLEGYDRIEIVDFSFPRSVIEGWAESGSLVTVLDHHKTAQEHLGDLSTFSKNIAVEFDMAECGATLAYKKYGYSNDMPAFLEYVRDRDLWNFELEQSEEIHESVSSARYGVGSAAKLVNLSPLPHVFALFDELAKMSKQDLVEKLGSAGEKLLEPKRQKIAAAANRANYEQLPDVPHSDQPKPYWKPIPIVRCEESEDRLVSDICSKLYRDLFPDAQFVGCITSDGKYSLRSNKNGSNYDVSAIAKCYGGGGHRNAAGFSVDG